MYSVKTKSQIIYWFRFAVVVEAGALLEYLWVQGQKLTGGPIRPEFTVDFV